MKAGSRVKLIQLEEEDLDSGLRIGDKGTIVEKDNHVDLYLVSWDEDLDDDKYWVLAEQIEELKNDY